VGIAGWTYGGEAFRDPQWPVHMYAFFSKFLALLTWALFELLTALNLSAEADRLQLLNPLSAKSDTAPYVPDSTARTEGHGLWLKA
jgi:hypothetical protein